MVSCCPPKAEGADAQDGNKVQCYTDCLASVLQSYAGCELAMNVGHQYRSNHAMGILHYIAVYMYSHVLYALTFPCETNVVIK